MVPWWIELGLLIVACVAVLTGGFTAWLGYKERTGKYRETLYAKQIDAVAAVLGTAVQFQLKYVMKLHGEDTESSTGCSADELRSMTAECWRQGMSVVGEVAAYLPNEVYDRFVAFYRIATAEYAQPDLNPKTGWAEAGDAFVELQKAARRCLGTDPLTEESMAILGAETRAVAKQTGAAGGD